MGSSEPCWLAEMSADSERATIRPCQFTPDFAYGEEDGQ